MTPTIRRARLADAEALAELASRTFRETFGADNTPEDLALHLASSYGREHQAREITDPAIITLVAEADAALVAFAQLRVGAAPTCVTGPAPVELQRFYVAAAFHGRGLAQRLMDAVLAEARAIDAQTIWLGVWERNPRAIAFYSKAGYRDVGAHTFMLGTDPQTDRILMRPLDAPSDHRRQSMHPGDHEARRRERLSAAAAEANTAAAHAAAVHAALDDGLRELVPQADTADARAYDIAAQELQATERELEAARAELSRATDALRATSAPLRALLEGDAFTPTPAAVMQAHKDAQAAEARARDRVEMLEAAVAELVQLRSEILRGR